MADLPGARRRLLSAQDARHGALPWRRRVKGQLDNCCRPCRSDYEKEHYAATTRRYVDLPGLRKRRLADLHARLLIDYFRDHPCVDCGETDPLVLEFDHLDDKSFAIARALRERSWEAILAEISKCEVCCANCHRRRTACRGGWARAGV